MKSIPLALLAAFLLLPQTAPAADSTATPAAKSAPPAAHAAPAEAPKPRKGWDFSKVGLTPIQSGGRMKPLDSYAREVVLHITGSRRFQGWDPVELVIAWTAMPEAWQSAPFILVQREDVRRQINLDDKRTKYAPDELLKNFALAQYADILSRDPSKLAVPPSIAKGEQTRKNDREAELKTVVDRLGLFHSHISGKAWQLIPQPGEKPWLAVDSKDGGDAGILIRQRFLDLLTAYRGGDQRIFEASSDRFREGVQSAVPGWGEPFARVTSAEVLYNKLRPFQWSWIIYLLAGLLWIFSSVTKKIPRKAAMAVTLAGVGLHTFGIALRCYVAGRPPVTNMYESVVWVSIGILVFALILYAITKNHMAPMVATFLATIFMIVGDSAPVMLDPAIRPLVPVLRSNYWLTIHVLTITLGYSAFALSCGIANVTLFHFLKPKAGGQARILEMNLLTYRAVQFGVVLLAAGTILGGIWADESWGRFWGWDPKEVWALIALLAYVAILHGRFAGWIDQFGFAVWTIIAFMTVLMAWYGVNFILGVGLHSYGFSSGGFGFVATFTGIQLGYVGAIVAARAARKRASGSPRAAAS